MFSGEAISQVVALLERRNASLVHACQLVDFQSYLRLAGIPSRLLLEDSGLSFTPFESDSSDRSRDVWDKAFLNLSDFGHWFAHGGRNTPNPYGPILLHVGPAALSEASDVAVCLRSVSASDFDRRREALEKVTDVDRLFSHPPDTQYSTYIRFANSLQQEFGEKRAHTPEISCTVPAGKISLANVTKITVDPYIINGRPLVARVQSLLLHYQTPIVTVQRRSLQRYELYQQFVGLFTSRVPNLQELRSDPEIDQPVREWATSLTTPEWAYQNFATYQRLGTLLPLAQDE